MEKLGVAVIGTGPWGQNHARIYKDLTTTNLIAICDSNPQTARNAANKFKVQAYTNTDELLKNNEIKAVSIATPSAVIAQETQKALNAGKHVLAEKPMATNTKEAIKLQQTAKQNNLHLTVGFLTRFIPGLQRIQEAIQTKEIGELISVNAKRVSKWQGRTGDAGVVKDVAINDIDAIKFISNKEPSTIYAQIGSMKYQGHEDFAQIALTYEDKKYALIESNWLTPYKTRTLTVTGSEAIMQLDYLTQEIRIENDTQTLLPRLPYKEPLKEELQHFIDCIQNHTTPKVTATDAIYALKIAEAATQSANRNNVIKLT